MKVIGSLLILCLCSWISGEKLMAQEKFRAASGGFSTAIHALLWVAYEKKIFQKYGLDGEYLALESGTPAMQALLANELQIVFTTGALAITANLQGADTTIVAGGINFIPNKLLVRLTSRRRRGSREKESPSADLARPRTMPPWWRWRNWASIPKTLRSCRSEVT